MKKTFIIDLSNSFEHRRDLFFEDIKAIERKYEEWFSKRGPLNHEEKFPDETDSIFNHFQWMESPFLKPFARLQVFECGDRPKEIEQEILTAYKNRFNIFDTKEI